MPSGIYQRTEKHRENLSKAWNYEKHFTEATRKKLSDSHIGRKPHAFSIETRRKMSLAKIGKEAWNKGLKGYYNLSEETKQKISIALKGKNKSPEFIKRISINFKINPNMGMKGKKESIETRRKISENNPKYWRGKHLSDSTRQKIREATKKLWQNSNYRAKQIPLILNGLLKRPTSFEKKIAELCIEYSLPFIYTGNGQFLINFKNPDFINEKDKVVIEVFYSYYKIRDYGSIENYKEFCRKKYEPAGWKVIFISEDEIDIKNWKEICLNKINIKNKF